MQKKIAIQLGIIAVMVVVLIFLSASLVSRKSKAPPKPAPGVPAMPQAVVKKPAKGMDFRKPVIKIRPMEDDNFYVKFCNATDALPLQRDPFSFLGTGPRSSRDNLELMGITWENGKPTAIIDQDFLRVGSSTDAFTVVNILQDYVILKDAKGEFELRLKQ